MIEELARDTASASDRTVGGLRRTALASCPTLYDTVVMVNRLPW
jgi:hypothetical protein